VPLWRKLGEERGHLITGEGALIITVLGGAQSQLIGAVEAFLFGLTASKQTSKPWCQRCDGQCAIFAKNMFSKIGNYAYAEAIVRKTVAQQAASVASKQASKANQLQNVTTGCPICSSGGKAATINQKDTISLQTPRTSEQLHRLGVSLIAPAP